jgi:hypothetical protein
MEPGTEEKTKQQRDGEKARRREKQQKFDPCCCCDCGRCCDCCCGFTRRWECNLDTFAFTKSTVICRGRWRRRSGAASSPRPAWAVRTPNWKEGIILNWSMKAARTPPMEVGGPMKSILPPLTSNPNDAIKVQGRCLGLFGDVNRISCISSLAVFLLHCFSLPLCLFASLLFSTWVCGSLSPGTKADLPFVPRLRQRVLAQVTHLTHHCVV